MSSAHLFSGLPGHDGTAELEHFARQIESDPEWIQKRGQGTEHLDLLGQKRIRAAREAGATIVSRRWMVDWMRGKRDFLQGKAEWAEG